MTTDAAPQSDVIAAMSDDLLNGCPDTLRHAFNDAGARAPLVIWSPGDEELQSPLLQRFALACRAMAAPDGRLRLTGFSADGLDRGLVDWLMIVAVEPGSFRYRAYGRGIAEHYGRDLTGLTTATVGGHIAAFFEALYRAAVRRGEWVLSEHEPPQTVFVRLWQRLIVPLFDEAGERVEAFAVLNRPENDLRTGLELMVDPVLVADGAGVVHYANEAAREMFGIASLRAAEVTLKQLTGIGLQGLPSPEDMLARYEVHESTELVLRGGIAERLVSTVSAAEHRRRAFHVIVLRKLGTLTE